MKYHDDMGPLFGSLAGFKEDVVQVGRPAIGALAGVAVAKLASDKVGEQLAAWGVEMRAKDAAGVVSTEPSWLEKAAPWLAKVAVPVVGAWAIRRYGADLASQYGMSSDLDAVAVGMAMYGAGSAAKLGLGMVSQADADGKPTIAAQVRAAIPLGSASIYPAGTPRFLVARRNPFASSAPMTAQVRNLPFASSAPMTAQVRRPMSRVGTMNGSF